ncbi:histidine--tRNA ligase [Candidatus Pacearchaeota archaeon]|nr:histidine--tRNA ligase [Candidatus Pacearchaeota archaeon]
MIYQPENVKGFTDYLPPESQKRAAVKAVIEKTFQEYGFIPIETPTIEYEELMKSNPMEEEDSTVSERFRLKDRGGRNLGLRYEFTFQLARIFKQNPNIKLPFRRYQIGSVFRDEPAGPNRFREFTQCDADIIGDSSIQADAEGLAIFADVFNKLKIKYEIIINNRKLLNSILDSVQIENKNQVIREIDKLDKLGEDEIKTNLRKYANTNQILSLFKLLEKDINFFKENMFDGAEEIVQLKEITTFYGFSVKFNPSLVRGFSYYTGNVWEVKAEGMKETIAAGGRYDKSVGRFINKEIPVVGISFGLDRIAKKADIAIPLTKAIVISIEKEKESIKLSQNLRKNNISCIVNSGGVGKALEYANSYNIQYAIFVGKDEVKQKKFKLKNLKSGEESLLNEKSVIARLKD